MPGLQVQDKQAEFVKAAEDHLYKMAQQELDLLRGSLESLFPRTTSATVALYQPLSVSPGGQCSARLVDVGPRPEGASAENIFQTADSGESGDFFSRADVHVRTVPFTKRIDENTITSYKNHNDQAHYHAQVALERLRYSSVIPEWTNSNSVLPLGAYIHQLGLIARRIDREGKRFPLTGLIYSINNWNGNEPERGFANDSQLLSWKLILYALEAGDIVLDTRLSILTGHRRAANNKAHQMTVNLLRMKGGMARLVGKLLLVHHWFYSFDPVAYRLMALIAPSNGVRGLFAQHLSLSPSPMVQGDKTETVDSLFVQTCDDIYQLIGYGAHFFQWDASLVERDKIRAAIATMLNLICGRLVVIEKKGSTNAKFRVTPVESVESLKSLTDHHYFSVAVTGLDCECVYVPAFGVETWERLKVHRLPQSCATAPLHLAPGGQKLSTAYDRSDLLITKWANESGHCTVDPALSKDDSFRWMDDYVRFRIHHSLLALKAPQ